MRLGEECPYITPCGFCSRQGKPCENKPRYRVDLPAVDFSPAVEAFKNMSKRFKAEAEQMKDRDMAAAALVQASTNFMKLDAEQETEGLKLPPLLKQEVEEVNKLASALNLPEVEEADTLSSTKGYCAASKSIKKY